MKITSEQPSDKWDKLLTITSDLFLQIIADRLKLAIKKHPKGFTFNIISLQLKTSFSSGIYLVGQRKHHRRFKVCPKHNEIVVWLCGNLSSIYSRGGFVGGWWNKEGVLILDVVAVISGRQNAMLSGRINGEEAIYHPYSGRDIEVIPPILDNYMTEVF